MIKHRSVRRLLASSAVWAAVPLLIAAKPHTHTPDRPLELNRLTAAPTFVRDGVTYDSQSGVPRAVYAPDYFATPATPEVMAREFLAENEKFLRLEDSTLNDLVPYFTRDGQAAATVRFRQTHQGLPVLGEDLAVTVKPGGEIVYLSSGYEVEISIPTTSPSTSAAAARQDAMQALGVAGNLSFDQTTLAVLPNGAQSRLVYQVKLVPRTKPTGDWEVLVDALSGEIVRVMDHASYADGTGLTWDPDPLSSAGVSYGGNYSDNGDATNAQLDAERATVSLLDITDLGGTFKLEGQYAEIIDAESPFLGLFTQASSTFNYNRSDQNFEAVLCYYHIDNIMRYLNETLGVSVAPIQYAGGARFDPHGLSGADNSHYISSTGIVAFGEGGVDDSEDADVVIHELGHALHDWVTGGNLSQVNGLSEGTGDFIAASYSRSLGQWTSADPEYQWVFSWDGHNPFWAGRITNTSATYPGGLTGSVHSDGQIWSTSLMRIWDEIGRDKIEQAVWEGLAMTNGSSSQNDAAQAVLNAASALGFTSSELNSIFTNFTTTGYTITSPTVALAAESPTLNSAGANGAADPGETVTFDLDLTNNGAVSATSVSAIVSSTTPGVVINQGASAYPDLGPGASGTNGVEYSITLPSGHVCGDPVALSIFVNYDEDGNPNSTTATSEMPTGVPVGASESVSPGLAIPDNNSAGVTSTLAVSGTGGTVSANLNVDVNITHTYQGDLIVRLESPAGTQVLLHNRTGGSANDIIGNYPLTLTPTQSLAAMIGDPLDGTWTLFVSDNAGIDLGTLNSWGINDVSGFDCDTGATDVTVVSVPGTFGLSAARPNPFGPETTIRFTVPESGSNVALEVFDVAGRHIRTLAEGFQPAGEHAVSWNGANDSGQRVGAGIYFYRLQGDDFEQTRKVIRLK